ncbi:MAG: thioredoxin domain-containing protein [Leptospiraceae bacterium]|nr:thioredoxin domain-containing protein [Leptospiraceae bacterium]
MKNSPSNRLAGEKSPYLLQHSQNPVDWYPWGEEAFSQARATNKPIFLSIGYATCHWCHVMERESFEDPNTAGILNQYFVSIKVDREERPDVDKVYMDILHTMNQQGGWPLNMFLTPNLLPIAGGTYFPPVSAYGRKSFREVLEIIHSAWNEKKEEILENGKKIVSYLTISEEMQTGLPSQEVFSNLFDTYRKYYDEQYGGFLTNHNNKFPPSMALSFLLSLSPTHDDEPLSMVEETLLRMKSGGIYDQIGGGLCRYSTDHYWLVPHFEKMLYDNSLFMKVLISSYAYTQKRFYLDSAADIIEYVERDLALSSGGIASAEDADSDGEEGKFYLWTREDFDSILKDDSGLMSDFWNVSHHGNFEGKSILNINLNTNILEKYNLTNEEFQDRFQKSRSKLLEARSQRNRPLRDDKVLTSWNALYIQALAHFGRITKSHEHITKASNHYAFIREKLMDSEGNLYRRFREGETGIRGFLVDHSELALAALDLYSVTYESNYIQNAIDLVESAIRLFYSNGIFYDSPIENQELIFRPSDGYDGVEPSGNSTMAKVLLSLSMLGCDTGRFKNLAMEIFQRFGKDIERSPMSFPNLIETYFLHERYPIEIAVVGEKNNPEIQKYLDTIHTNYLPGIVVAYSSPEELNKNSEIIPLLKNRNTSHAFAVFVCKNGACDLPDYSYTDAILKLKKIYPYLREKAQ